MADWDRRAYGGGRYREREEDPSQVHSRFRKKVITITIIIVALIFTGGVFVAAFFVLPDYKAPLEEKTENGALGTGNGETDGSVIALPETDPLNEQDPAEPDKKDPAEPDEKDPVEPDKKDPAEPDEKDPAESDEKDPVEPDPEEETGAQSREALDFNMVKASNPLASEDGAACGIDVSSLSGEIDWRLVKESGVRFAMIRAGYRTKGGGEIIEDAMLRDNLGQAMANGINTGVYFVSSAVSETEAWEEAEFVLGLIAQYPITCPVAYKCQGFKEEGSRQKDLTRDKRMRVARAFLDRVFLKGYTPLFYAPAQELSMEAEWDTAVLSEEYEIWVAEYASAGSSLQYPFYEGEVSMWRLTDNGAVPGVPHKAGIDILYISEEKNTSE